MAWQPLLTTLAQARQRFDQQSEELCAETRSKRTTIYCEKGCGNCCSLAVNCSFPEALAIAQTLDGVQQQSLKTTIPRLQEISRQAENLKDFLQQFRQQINGCPWLHAQTGCCRIYQQRPFSCRALHSTRNSNWCGVDFGSLHPLEKEAFLSSLDPELVAFPTHYLAATQQLGLKFESQALDAMRAAFAVSLSGNLLYLLWLELEHRLSEVLPEGHLATRTFLEERQLDLPFLLQLQGNALG